MAGIKGVKLLDIDKGWKALKKDIEELHGSFVKVGVLGAKGDESRPGEGGRPITNVELAVIHEFGAPAAKIPARPFVSGAYEAHKEEYRDAVKKGMEKVFDRKLEVRKLLGLIGAKAAADMKNYVTKGKSPFEPNAPSVYARKLAKGSGDGDPRPLVDTGRMVDSISWSVVLGKEKA